MALTIGELKALAFKAGFNSDEVPTAAAIAMAESSGNPNATNTNTNGSTDKGLWQINSVNAFALALGNPFDPATNASMAYKVYKQQGWRAWVAYTNGAYRKFVDTKTPYATLPGLKVQDIPGTNTTLPDLVSGAASKVTDIPSAISAGISAFNANFQKIAGNTTVVIIAVVLLIVGIVILMRAQVSTVVAAATPVGKVAGSVASVATTKSYKGTHRA